MGLAYECENCGADCRGDSDNDVFACVECGDEVCYECYDDHLYDCEHNLI